MINHSPPPRPGTYVLILYLPKELSLIVGGLGTFDLEPGYYTYVGSARGPGGLAARIARHARKGNPLRWHIDYLRPHTQWRAIWWTESPQRLECKWAQALSSLPGATKPIPGFGASDCQCVTHLLAFSIEPDAMLVARLPGTVHIAAGALGGDRIP
ncbi:MAG: GIY-YIG nuclease family protein [Chloroflexi bacterium]|nr:GIY-YIG nuclease family protein [Chloroflexota bacterium]